MTDLNEAACRGHTASVELLIRAGANVKTTDRYGWAPLSWACWISDASNNYARNRIARMLCDAGADVNYYCSRGENKSPPIVYASAHGNLECVQMLCDAGADVNIFDGSDRTAMAKAKKGGHTAIVAMLKENGAIS